MSTTICPSLVKCIEYSFHSPLGYNGKNKEKYAPHLKKSPSSLPSSAILISYALKHNYDITLSLATMPKRKLPASDDDEMQTFEYREGMRHVLPYYRTLRSFIKSRWVGKNVIDVCEQEFRAYDREHYEKAALNGELQVFARETGSQPVQIHGRLLKFNDELVHKMLFQETPVPDQPISVIFEDDKILAVDKPAGWPVHPCGGYGVNSITEELKRQYPKSNFLPLHRLDRLTSGLLLFTKNPETAAEMSALLASEDRSVCEKIYVARVKGKFTEYHRVECYLKCIDPRIGEYGVSSDNSGKWSVSNFYPLIVGEEESLVQCKLETGRTHQIRIHLNHIGFPIVNDDCYGGEYDPNHKFAFPKPAGFHATGIFLHAHKYSIPGFIDVETPKLPDWAKEL
jgi:RluA family pseudouridine synthase